MMTGEWQFLWSWAFWLIPLPILFYFLLPPGKQSLQSLYIPFIADRHVELTGKSTGRTSMPALVLLAACWLSFLLALSRPTYIGEPVELPVNGRDLLMAVDISGSMKIKDMQIRDKPVNRLVVVKNVVDQFIRERQGDRIGLILFASRAFVQAPLTFDLNTVSELLREAEIGFAGQETAIGDAIGLAIKRLANNPADSRILILLTDGQNTAGEVDPLQAAKLAQQEKVVIYTIGIGSDQPVRSGLFGLSSYNPSRDLDEASLKEIASTTGGQYFRARNRDELNQIYATIDQLEAIEQEAETFRPKQTYFHYPLLLAMALFFLLVLSRRFSTSRSLAT